MTGTAETEAAEFFNTYGLHVVPIPTNKPIIRDVAVDLIYSSERGKYGAVVEDIVERNKKVNQFSSEQYLLRNLNSSLTYLINEELLIQCLTQSFMRGKLMLLRRQAGSAL